MTDTEKERISLGIKQLNGESCASSRSTPIPCGRIAIRAYDTHARCAPYGQVGSIGAGRYLMPHACG